MSRIWLSVVALLVLLASGCSTVPFAPTVLVPAEARGAAELIGGLWESGSGSLLVQQSALFEFQGMRVPLVGIMKFDLAGRNVRLVGMNDMGVKLYDISVNETSSETHFMIPELSRYPGFAEAVASSVRRIFLSPEPVPGDLLTYSSKEYLFSRENGLKTIHFVIGGSERQLVEKEAKGPREAWRARYYQYQRLQGNLIPTGIVLDDFSADYRLTLWIESVEKIDE